jgi:rhomboid-like protein
MPPAAATVISLILANSIILVMWRIPPAWRFLNKHFLSTPVYPSAMSILGNVFSHQQVKHFLANMVVLWFIGTKRRLLSYPKLIYDLC